MSSCDQNVGRNRCHLLQMWVGGHGGHRVKANERVYAEALGTSKAIERRDAGIIFIELDLGKYHTQLL